MRIDLEQALSDIAGSVHDEDTAERMSGQVRHMVGRVRRRRAARHTAQGVVGVGTAAAVTLVGVNLDPFGTRDGQVPWGSATGDPDPDGVLPALQFPECGATAPASGEVTGGDPAEGSVLDLAVEYVDDAPSGGPVRASATGTELTGATVLRDGVVVTEMTTDVSVGTSDGPVVWTVAVDPVDCRTDERLPAGVYELAVTTRPEGGGEGVVRVPFDIVPSGDDQAGAEADRLRAEGEAAIARHLEAPNDAFPACASRLPAVADPPLVLELDDTDPAAPEAVLRTTDGRSVIANAFVGAAGLVVLRDGIVVGGRLPDGDGVDLVDLGPDDSLRLATTPSLDVCGATTSDGGALPLPPGTYQLVATLEVMLKEVVTADGEAFSVTEPLVVTSVPVDVVIP